MIKSIGTLTGYLDLGEVNNLRMAAEEKFKDPSSNMQRPLAKHMLIFMVRGLFTSLKFPYAQFPAASSKGTQLFPFLTWYQERSQLQDIECLLSRKAIIFHIRPISPDQSHYKFLCKGTALGKT